MLLLLQRYSVSLDTKNITLRAGRARKYINIYRHRKNPAYGFVIFWCCAVSTVNKIKSALGDLKAIELFSGGLPTDGTLLFFVFVH